VLLGTALGGPGGQKALLSRRFKGDLGNFRKKRQRKKRKKNTEQAISSRFWRPLLRCFQSASVKNYEKLREGSSKNKKTQKYSKTRFWPRTSRGSEISRTLNAVSRRPFWTCLGPISGVIFVYIVMEQKTKKERKKTPEASHLKPI
jgi:hypothetical protein